MSEEQTPQVKCPKCGSTQIVAGKKGFSGKKAVAGAVLTGGIGILAGTIGSNKIKITCLNCGNVFSPGDNSKSQANQSKSTTEPTPMTTGGWILLIIIIISIIIIVKSCNDGS